MTKSSSAPSFGYRFPRSSSSRFKSRSFNELRDILCPPASIDHLQRVEADNLSGGMCVSKSHSCVRCSYFVSRATPSTLDPATRFERHKYGVKDNSYVRRYGVRLRPDLYAGFDP